MRQFLMAFALVMPALAMAETGPAKDVTAAPLEAAKAAIARNRDLFLDLATDAINGHGGPGGLTAEALEGAILLERAEARATLLRRFLVVDLNNDGAVSLDEVTIVADAASASARARLLRLVEKADHDRDGQVSAAEIATMAEAAALKAVPEMEAQALRGLMGFDTDGNGLVTVEEATLGIDAVVIVDGT